MSDRVKSRNAVASFPAERVHFLNALLRRPQSASRTECDAAGIETLISR